jgi:ribosomal protein S18 acetylase RimI-like enzyme
MDLSDPRPLRPADVPSIHALIDRCYREYGLRLNLADECEAHLRDPGPYFRAGGGEFWVMTDDEGLARATAALYLHSDNPRAELKSMYVDVACRRRGLGSRLTRLVIAEARRRGRREVVLWSDTRFEAAHRMYESLGFVRTGRRELTDSNNSSEWGYVLALTAGDEPPRA